MKIRERKCQVNSCKRNAYDSWVLFRANYLPAVKKKGLELGLNPPKMVDNFFTALAATIVVAAIIFIVLSTIVCLVGG